LFGSDCPLKRFTIVLKLIVIVISLELVHKERSQRKIKIK